MYKEDIKNNVTAIRHLMHVIDQKLDELITKSKSMDEKKASEALDNLKQIRDKLTDVEGFLIYLNH